MPKKALFIDRDGVINLMAPSETEGFDSPQTPDQVALVPGIAEVIAFCNAQGVPVIEISNQPGAAKGKMTFEHLEAIETRVHELLAEKGARVDASYRCFHHPKATVTEFLLECDCRKPKPGLLLQAAQEMDIDLKGSLFLGDAASDMEAGQAAGCKTLFYFHENDTPEKIAKKQTYREGDQAYVTDHRETLAFVMSFFA